MTAPGASRETRGHSVVVQLSDPHVGADWGPGGAASAFAAAVDAVLASDLRPAAVLVSGDLADHADGAEYEQVRTSLARLAAPVCVLAGNHDARRALRRHFDVPGRDDEPVQYARDAGGLRVVVLDTTRPGEDRGELDHDRLGWLEAELAAAPETPTLLAMHHPPITTGVPAWDELGLPPADQGALAAVVARHPQVIRLAAGHLHRTIAADLDGRPVLAAPSTYVQARLDLNARELAFADEPAGFVVHALLDGRLSSHVRPLA